MRWNLLKERQKIIRIIEYLISGQIQIKIRIEGDRLKYLSRIIEILPTPHQGNTLGADDESLALVVEKLAPDRGNNRIQQFPEAALEFLMKEYLCRCHAKYVCISSIYPHYGLIIDLPAFIELEEKREVDRITFDLPKSASAIFRVANDGNDSEQLHEMGIINCSGQGLGLLVKEEDFDLLQILKPGDRISGIRLLSGSSVTRLDSTVRHKTEIEDGEYRGDYILGLESDVAVDCDHPGAPSS